MENKEMIQTPWFFDYKEILNKLNTSTEGLSEVEAKERFREFGENILIKKRNLNVFRLIIKQLMSPLIFILFGAVVLTGFLGEWLNMSVIIGAILINAGLGFYREYQAENTLIELESYIKDRSRVIRDNFEKEIESSLLVPGDIIKLSYGSRIPADARLINVNNLRVDEAILTGESVAEVKKAEIIDEATPLADRVNMVYAGTLVVDGFALAVVINTGEKTEIGKIANLVARTKRVSTPLQKGVNQLSWYIFAVALFVIMVIFVLGMYRGEPMLQMLILSAAVAVGAVPEALPIALTVILSVGAQRIASKKGIIRKLIAVETLGSTTLIMTDKTGTLTKAEMELVDIFTAKDLLINKFFINKIKHLSTSQKEILEMALNNINVLVHNPNEVEAEWKMSGHPLEVNVLKAAIAHNLPVREKIKDENFLYIPFNSSNKFSVSKKKNIYTIIGAPDVLLEKSNLNKEDYLKISEWIQELSNQGQRLLAVGNFKDDSEKLDIDSIKNINFLGILTFFDPVREDVPSAIENIKTHKVKVVIITGDLKGTAISVGRGLGWEILDNEVLTGENIRIMSDEELLSILPKIKIFARVTPEDKLRIGNLYRQLGEIVAMTGDGVNDAPALKAMDIGISLGTGSDVAQSAADLVLLDDNFQTINMAIDEGRRILTNIRKTFVYLMSNALDSVFVVGGSLIMNIALPINALQIIWVNLFTGSLPALAFAYDENLDKGIDRNNSKNKMLSKEVKILSFGLGTVSSLLIFLIYYFILKLGVEIKVARSVFFVCFSVYILIISFSFRSLYRPIFSYNPFGNKKLNIAVLIALGLLLITMSFPFMRNLFDIAPMPISWIWLIILWGILNIMLVEFAKWVFRIRINFLNKKSKFA